MLTAILFLQFCFNSVFSMELSASAPVNPVREQGILSLMCQMWDLDSTEYSVRISRRREVDSQAEWISYNDQILVEDERVYLATRHVGDGSVVYFLTFTDVARHDQGEYTCTILHDLNTIATKSVVITVEYVPEEIYPVCEPQDLPHVQEGIPVTFNCTSEEAHPPVSLTWERTGSRDKLWSTETRHNGFVVSTLSLIPSIQDQGTVFLCKIVSTGYYPNPKSCHVGPLKVLHNQQGISPPPTETSDGSGTLVTLEPHIVNLQSTVTTRNCRSSCSYFNMSVVRWILSTIFAVFLAVLFFIVGLILLYRLNQTITDHRGEFISRQNMTNIVKDDIYMELEKRRDGERVYMALDRVSNTYNALYNHPVTLQYQKDFDNTDIEKHTGK